MYRFVYFIGRTIVFLFKRLSDSFWNKYLVSYCRYRKEVYLKDWKSLSFTGKSLIAISKGSKVYIGKNVVVNSGYHTVSPSSSKINVCGGELIIGDNSGISSTVIICKESIKIGSNVNIGAGCLILDTNMHSTDWRIRAERDKDRPENAKKKPIVIEDNVFIGARCIIGKGVTIGSCTMIAAGSVVTSDIPANCIAGGNPCVVLKQLPDLH